MSRFGGASYGGAFPFAVSSGLLRASLKTATGNAPSPFSEAKLKQGTKENEANEYTKEYKGNQGPPWVGDCVNSNVLADRDSCSHTCAESQQGIDFRGRCRGNERIHESEEVVQDHVNHVVYTNVARYRSRYFERLSRLQRFLIAKITPFGLAVSQTVNPLHANKHP